MSEHYIRSNDVRDVVDVEPHYKNYRPPPLTTNLSRPLSPRPARDGPIVSRLVTLPDENSLRRMLDTADTEGVEK